MFTAAFFTIAKTGRQPKCPLTGEWIKMLRYIYIYTQWNITQPCKRMPSAATWVELEIIILREVGQTKTDTIRYHLYVESN